MTEPSVTEPSVTEKVRKKNVRKSREDRTQGILGAARAVFEERGYEAATIVDIAERVDVVEGTVLHYFGSKRALVLAVMEAFYSDITRQILEQLHGVDGVRNQLYFVIWSHLKVLSESSALCAVILRESRNLDRVLTQEVHDKNRLYTNVVKDIVARGIENGELRPDAWPSLVRNVIFGTTEHFFWDQVVGGTQVDLSRVAEQLTQLIYDGIAAGGSTVDARSVNQLISKLNALLPSVKTTKK